MAHELVRVDASASPCPVQEDADFTDVGRRELLRRLSLGAVLVAIGAPSWLRAGARSSLRPLSATSTGLVPLDSSGEIKGAYASKSILAILSTGLGIAAAGFAFAEFPVVGLVLGVIGGLISLVGAIVGIFWNPSPGEIADDIWALIKAKVQNLINVSITDVEFAALSGAIDGLKNNMLDYVALVQQHKQLRSAQSLSELRQKYIAVDAYCISVRPQFLPEGSQSRFLVLFAQFANLHHILLQDMVLNGKAYGVDPGIVANDVEKLARAIAQNCATFDHFWSEFLGKCANSRIESGMGADHPVFSEYGEKYYNWVENALYYRNRDVSDSIAQVTALAKDYRDLWPYMGGLRRGPASLTRELWFGPFGAPDCFEFGGDFTIINNAYKHKPLSIPWQNTGGYAAARQPADSPPAALSWFSVSQFASPAWQFPTGIDFGRAGDGRPAPQNGFVIRTSDDQGGPVTGVSILLGQYYTVMMESSIPVAGRVVNTITFTQTNTQTGAQRQNTVGQQVGLSTYPGDGDQFVTTQLDVPDDHVLSGLHAGMRVQRLYNEGNSFMRNLGENQDPKYGIMVNQSSIGSMMFGFRLKDPTLAPDTATLAAIHAANPELPSLDAGRAVAAVKAVRQAHGQVVSAQEEAALHATFERTLADPALAARSEAFQRVIADRLARMRAGTSS